MSAVLSAISLDSEISVERYYNKNKVQICISNGKMGSAVAACKSNKHNIR